MDSRVQLYDGQEPYVFISYTRKDSERVFPLLQALTEAKYRIWFDAGIQAGAHWTETLVEKVEKSSIFCPLYSEAFNISRFCFEETEYAYRTNKTIVPIYLDDVSMSEQRPLFRLLGSRQSLRLYQYNSIASFVASLEQENTFDLCKIPEWKRVGQIQWRLDNNGKLTIAMNERLNSIRSFMKSIQSSSSSDVSSLPLSLLPVMGQPAISPMLRTGYSPTTESELDKWISQSTSFIPAYQWDPVHGGSTAPWMPFREKIISLEVASNIREIGRHAFEDCENLTSVILPESMNVIGAWAFVRCRSLENVNIPDSVTRIGECAFSGCCCLVNIQLTEGVDVHPSAFDAHTIITKRQLNKSE